MTPAPIRRHALVIAVQCDSKGHLEQLGPAARGLHGVLIDPELGCCEAGLEDGRSLIVDTPLESPAIRDLVIDGFRYAGKRGAVFVLALLGHGFTPGQSSTLYYMGKESAEEKRDRGVDVNNLLLNAVEHEGVRGVIGLLDMCSAGGAMPTAHELASGVRGGRGRISLLMASSVDQVAEDLRFSRILTRVLKDGFDDAGAVVSVGSAGRAMRPILGQDVVIDERDGDQRANSPLWLARNARYNDSSMDSLVGYRAREGVKSALAALAALTSEETSGRNLQVPTDLPKAEALHRELISCPPGVSRDRAVTAVTGMITAVKTVEFIRSWIDRDLTTGSIRRALNLLLSSEPHAPSSTVLPTDTGALDYLAFEHPLGEDCRRWVTRFVLLLAQETGKELADPALNAWAENISAQVLVNDAREFAQETHSQHRLSLVVSLHASVAGDWPEMLDCWLLDNGTLLEHRQFPCAARRQRATEIAVDDAVIWATDKAFEQEIRLRRVDVAVPAKLLLKWRPEEAGEDEALGARHTVVLHWSGRLAPTRLLKRLQGAVRDRWEAVNSCTDGAPVDWVGAEMAVQQEALAAALRQGRYPRAIGLDHNPGARAELIEMLLGYTPVLLWPHNDTGRTAQWQQDLDRYWLTMPTGILRAYQRSWQGDDTDAIADLRLVWDNKEWLDFCRRLALPEPPARSRPKEAT